MKNLLKFLKSDNFIVAAVLFTVYTWGTWTPHAFDVSKSYLRMKVLTWASQQPDIPVVASSSNTELRQFVLGWASNQPDAKCGGGKVSNKDIEKYVKAIPLPVKNSMPLSSLSINDKDVAPPEDFATVMGKKKVEQPIRPQRKPKVPN